MQGSFMVFIMNPKRASPGGLYHVLTARFIIIHVVGEMTLEELTSGAVAAAMIMYTVVIQIYNTRRSQQTTPPGISRSNLGDMGAGKTLRRWFK